MSRYTPRHYGPVDNEICAMQWFTKSHGIRLQNLAAECRDMMMMINVNELFSFVICSCVSHRCLGVISCLAGLRCKIANKVQTEMCACKLYKV